MPAQPHPSLPRDHLPTLDGLRGCAVLLVMLTHASLTEAAPWLEDFKNTIRAGYFGVDIFFVLSGLLVTRVLRQDWAGGRSLGRFLWRRSLRIFPAYYMLLLVLLVVAPGWYLLACALYVSNVTDAMWPTLEHPLRHAWSLAIEEQFYLVWPALFYLCGDRRARIVASIGMPCAAIASLAILASLVYAGVASSDEAGDWTYRLPTTRLLSLSLGCSLAFAERRLRANRRLMLGMAIGTAALAAVVMWIGYVELAIPAGAPGTFAFAFVSTSAVLTALWLHDGPRVLRALLANLPLTSIGRISYGLYLYHFPIYLAFGIRYMDDRPSMARVLAAVGTTFVAATLSYITFERPILQARDRIPTPAALWRRIVS
ncbi:MAG: acyltransferase [Phycisphaerae bacterium]|nr:acyltransferase [Phycisphaerae bacterium]